MSWRLGVDIGGTFTDFALMKEDGSVFVDKALSTPQDRSLAVMEGLGSLAEREGCSLRELLAQIDSIVHGTTVADNTLIEMSGARTGLLTTQGFRDELELRRGFKEDIWDVRLPPPPVIVPRRRRLTVPERILFDGRIHLPLDEPAARHAIARLEDQGVESVAVATLFSFVNPVHELRLGELLAELLPGVPVSLSHQVMPKAPEFERTSTTVLNAYIGPRVTGYLDRLGERLQAAGYAGELLVMQSSGGVMTREYIRRAPVRVLASGPAGGVIGSARAGLAKDEPQLLCVDMGGTSYDVSLVRDGRAPAEPGWNWHHRYVIGLPMVSVETLGAGGGSLCHVHEGRLEVGPGSAGADPGPVCYGRGGTRPTITDANLVLGLLSPESPFAGGRFRLSRDGVDEAFRTHVANPMGCSVEEAAFDCWRVVNANMCQAVRRLTAERGTDPRTLTLLAYGGNGPLFAATQARELGIGRVVIPRSSPAFSALGALVALPGLDEERSYLVAAGKAEPVRLRALWRDLHSEALRHLAVAGFGPDACQVRFQLNLRYPGQNWSLAIDAHEGSGEIDWTFTENDLLPAMVERFHQSHEREYGHRRMGEEPEITGARLISTAAVAQPAFSGGFEANPREAKATGRRRVQLGRGFEEADVFVGSDLQPGDRAEGPALVEESFTTIVLPPGWQLRVDDAGDLQLAAEAS
ncbi:MAG: hydantoinase/oxoprolinase family protein [Deltaproteobacteria bacterium]|nr:hydantoinase/oxoprolinase family protein [Deltaproteobacteria bacterium]